METNEIAMMLLGIYLWARSYTDGTEFKTASQDYKTKYIVDSIVGFLLFARALGWF